jgi:hypothetical protein
MLAALYVKRVFRLITVAVLLHERLVILLAFEALFLLTLTFSGFFFLALLTVFAFLLLTFCLFTGFLPASFFGVCKVFLSLNLGLFLVYTALVFRKPEPVVFVLVGYSLVEVVLERRIVHIEKMVIGFAHTVCDRCDAFLAPR